MSPARDLLHMDEAELEQRIDAVKRRLPQPPGQRLHGYTREWHDTVPTEAAPFVPMDYRPAWYEKTMAAHAASEIHDDDAPARPRRQYVEPGVDFMGKVILYAALVAAIGGTLAAMLWRR